MKLFSRKSLVAAAASTALFAGMVAAPAQAEIANPDVDLSILAAAGEGDDNPADAGEGDDAGDTGDDNPAGNDADDAPEQEEGSSDQLSSGSSDSDGNLQAGEIRDWVAVFTAIIGALSTVFVFMERNF